MPKRYLSEKEIKTCELEILLKIQEFCQRQNLCFYLSGGTLLGAIRHHGFIPWDDDIDICMPRPDYEKFIQSFPQDDIYQIKSNILKNWDNPFSKIIDTRTKIESLYDETGGSLWVDVFPVDGLPQSLKQVEMIYKRSDFYRKLFMIGHARLGKGKSKFHQYGKYFLKPIVNFIGTNYFSQKMEEIAQQITYENAEYVGAITWGLYGVGERMLKSEFEKQIMVEFEGYQFPTFSCWDSYLHGLYGNYMQLPPVEKRQTHDMKVYKEI